MMDSKYAFAPQGDTISSKAVHYTHTLEKTLPNNVSQCLCSEDAQKPERPMGSGLTLVIVSKLSNLFVFRLFSSVICVSE